MEPLAAERYFLVNGVKIKTPLFLPSFSSKGFKDIQKIWDTTIHELITHPVLISSYDISYGYLKGQKKFFFPPDQPIFLDSGGYESSKDHDLADPGYALSEPQKWNRQFHLKVLKEWPQHIPTISISFDHPRVYLSLIKQIEHAKKLFSQFPHFTKEMLIKPEKRGNKNEPAMLNIANIVSNIHELRAFDIIGVTEKELGSSFKIRMENIAKIRNALNKIGSTHVPIHVFGSLDAISSTLYFLSGADIFDGLTWLRFSYSADGLCLYKLSYEVLNNGVNTNDKHMDYSRIINNYTTLKNIEHGLRTFLKNKSYNSLICPKAGFYKKSMEGLEIE